MSEVTHDGQGVFPPSAAGPAADGNAAGARQVIRSPEQVALDLSIAGPMSRVLAFSIDYGIILLIDVLLIFGLMFLAAAFVDLEAEMAWLGELAADGDGLPSVGGFLLFVFGLFILIQFAIEWGYFVLVEHLMQGRSPGKASLGLRVVRADGLPVGLRESMIRNLLRVVDMLPTGYLFGLVAMMVTRDSQRLGDLAAGTLVVREDRGAPALPIAAVRGSQRSASDPVYRFERRQLEAVGANERRLIRQTLRRLEGLSPRKRHLVLDRAIQVVCGRIGYTESIPPRERQAFLTALLCDAEEA